ncbi:Dephospho-CoA kinase [Gemmata obscuriglobus]|uniref:dephospho-CoA kinase n=1 Tax=Gemmata obscuriglobus TaxID=114 RepID=UPI00016C4CAA|nr:dephospho-CoA kinase [Gemmata obscuriglobus]QEG28551.1 Dephospho-CoA kinase [Gemmata obscuriglobus]VTS06650.1 dephospho- kinase : Dephospho-CoA kinase OS=Planctomyces brasiliensis (strain ATCC 49424 / DSM 5305 / JCM 21570 / NBRC 103401 / IFAM 1448) GN=coaE PE=3 SV=1: CoaE [Gemmata obscuriglobus UQM 2246]
MSFKYGPKPVVGLIGAIGAGKSTAARCFTGRGGQVIDADALGHEALRQPEIVAALMKRWGERIVREDGSLDRREIGRIVFADRNERSALEATVFPYINRRTQTEISAAQANPDVGFVVLDAAVLLEAGWGDLVDTLAYVDAPREMRSVRLAARSGWDEAELTARESAQWSAEAKKARADTVLVNDGSRDELQAQVDRFVAQFCNVNGVRL